MPKFSKIQHEKFKPNLVVTILSVIVLFIAQVSSSSAQGELRGKVLDEKKEPILSATVQVFQGGIFKGGNVTDFDGNYVIKPLEPGLYDVLVTFAGYDSVLVSGVSIMGGENIKQNVVLWQNNREIEIRRTGCMKKPLVSERINDEIHQNQGNVRAPQQPVVIPEEMWKANRMKKHKEKHRNK